MIQQDLARVCIATILDEFIMHVFKNKLNISEQLATDQVVAENKKNQTSKTKKFHSQRTNSPTENVPYCIDLAKPQWGELALAYSHELLH